MVVVPPDLGLTYSLSADGQSKTSRTKEFLRGKETGRLTRESCYEATKALPNLL